MGMSDPSIYVNLLGEWTLLSPEESTIFNRNPYVWIKEESLHEFHFIHVGHKEKGYKIHISQLQVTN